MMRRPKRRTIVLVVLCALGVGEARGSDPVPVENDQSPVENDQSPVENNQSPVRISLTEQSSLIYNGENRDTRSGDVTTLTNDNFGLWNNRLDAQASTGGLVVSVRLDTLWFLTRPDPTRVALEMVELRGERGGPGPGEPSDAQYFREKLFEAGRDLSNRDINWTIPAKYFASYRTHLSRKKTTSLKVTLGDFYAQLGRGLVLSVRKQDSLASDTTLRGARTDLTFQFSKTRIKTVLLLGTGNPLRVDETSGRYLGVHHSALRGLQHATEAGMPRAIETDFTPDTGRCETMATCSYAPDDLYAAQVQLGFENFELETQGSLLLRHTRLSGDVVRSAERIVTFSQGLQIPSLAKVASAYVEVAGQERGYDSNTSRGGYAVYAHLDWFFDPLQLTLEGKHYRAFYPLSAGIDTARAPQFSQVQYSQVPTTEPMWNTSQFENFNTCTSGGRTRLDVDLSPRASLFGWVGRYDTWAESVANERCETDPDKLNQVWDLAVGAELRSRDHRSLAKWTAGIRDDRTKNPLVTPSGETRVFYRESYIRYDALFYLGGALSLQFQGWHRYRHQTIGGPADPWLAGQTVNALEVAPFGNLALGIEYDTNPLTPTWYFNGQLTYRITSASNATLFVGQRRGALRCVAGVCRVFPPFEGARLDLTLRL